MEARQLSEFIFGLFSYSLDSEYYDEIDAGSNEYDIEISVGDIDVSFTDSTINFLLSELTIQTNPIDQHSSDRLHLELKLKPALVTTGTFFHKASIVVVTPLKGKLSKHISILS